MPVFLPSTSQEGLNVLLNLWNYAFDGFKNKLNRVFETIVFQWALETKLYKICSFKSPQSVKEHIQTRVTICSWC